MVAALQQSSCGANGVAIGIGAMHGCQIESGPYRCRALRADFGAVIARPRTHARARTIFAIRFDPI